MRLRAKNKNTLSPESPVVGEKSGGDEMDISKCTPLEPFFTTKDGKAYINFIDDKGLTISQEVSKDKLVEFVKLLESIGF